jgi:hypothetical protein
VYEMLRGMSLSQLREWRAFADLEPFDEERMDIRFASLEHRIASDLSAVITTIASGVPTVSVARSRRVMPPKFSLDDFRLRFGDSRKPVVAAKPWQQLKALAKGLASAFNKGHAK